MWEIQWFCENPIFTKSCHPSWNNPIKLWHGEIGMHLCNNLHLTRCTKNISQWSTMRNTMILWESYFHKIPPSLLKQSNQTLTRRDWNAPLQQPPSSWMHQKYFRALFHLLGRNIRGGVVYIYKDDPTNNLGQFLFFLTNKNDTISLKYLFNIFSIYLQYLCNIHIYKIFTGRNQHNSRELESSIQVWYFSSHSSLHFLPHSLFYIYILICYCISHCISLCN